MAPTARSKERTGTDRTTVIRWLNECVELAPGESISIPCDNAHDRKLLLSNFYDELKVMSKIDPLASSVVFAKESYKDSRHWIILERKNPVSKVAYKKDSSGTIERQEINYLTFERRRILDLMIKDGLKIDLIAKIIGDLTKSEIKYLKRKGGLR